MTKEAMFVSVLLSCSLLPTPIYGASNQETGELQVPPQLATQYPKDIDTSWTISTKADQIFTLTFSRFNMEDSVDCSKDFVQIFDGSDVSSPSLGKYCGTSLPNAVSTSQQHVSIKFTSDGNGTGNGFRLHWQAVRPDSTDSPQLGSFRYPSTGLYPQTRFQFALIISNAYHGGIIHARFPSVDIKFPAVVFVRDGGNLDDKYLSTISGSYESLVTSTKNTMLFHFDNVSNSSVPGTGLSVNWEKTVSGAQNMQPSLKTKIWLTLPVILLNSLI